LRAANAIKKPHALQVANGKAAPQSCGEVAGQTLQQLLAVSCPLGTALLEFHNAPTDLPIGRRHERIDGAGAGTSSSLQQSTDTAEQAGVTAGGGRTGGVFLFDGFLHAALVAS
jgi:hypothetical protein